MISIKRIQAGTAKVNIDSRYSFTFKSVEQFENHVAYENLTGKHIKQIMQILNEVEISTYTEAKTIDIPVNLWKTFKLPNLIYNRNKGLVGVGIIHEEKPSVFVLGGDSELFAAYINQDSIFIELVKKLALAWSEAKETLEVATSKDFKECYKLF